MPSTRRSRSPFSDPIAQHLTPRLHAVQRSATLRNAAARMAVYGVRHLPVLDGERVAGLVREGELHMLERFGALSFDVTTVDAVMCCDLNLVQPRATLASVIADMEQKRYDHALVLDRTRLVGIFTVTDALRLLALDLEAAAPARVSA